jgi:hypothetical protein
MVWTVAEELRAGCIPFVFLTGYAGSIELRGELKEAPRIGTPIEPKQLLSALL